MDTYVYKIGNNLYVNLTNRCSNRCTFCVRDEAHPFEGYDLWIKECEPTAQQIIDLIANGVEHIHIYSMNKPEIAARIQSSLSEVLK